MKHRPSISTKHILAFASIILAVWLFIAGAWDSSSFIMSFAETGVQHTLLRAAAIIGLLIILFSRPPRSMSVRVVLGALSSIILSGSYASMIDYHVGVLDAILYLQVSIILTLEAMENNSSPVEFSAQEQ